MEIQEIREGNVQEDVQAPVQNIEPKVETKTEPIEVQEEKIDYQALYEAEKAKLAKAEFTLYKKSKEERDARNKQLDGQGYTDPGEIERIVEERTMALFEAQRQKESEDVLEEELMRLSSDEDERRLIRLRYDNSLVKTGYSRLAIRNDLEEAKFLANKPKYLKEKNELYEAAISKRTTSSAPQGATAERQEPQSDLSKQFSKRDWEWMEKRGWSDEQKRAALKNK